MFNRDAYCQRYFMRKEAGIGSTIYNWGGKALNYAGNFINNHLGGFLSNHFGDSTLGNLGTKMINYSKGLTRKGTAIGKIDERLANEAAKASQVTPTPSGNVTPQQ